MSQSLKLAQKIRQLKTGSSFFVRNRREQAQVCRMAKTLRDCGAIDFDIVTKTTDEGIKVAAI